MMRLVGLSGRLATLVAVIALLAVAGRPSPASAQARPELGRPGQEPVEIVSGEILVKFKPGTRGQAIAEAHRQNGGREREQIGQIGVHVVDVPPGEERRRVAAYSANPNVEFAEVNGHYYAVGPAQAAPAPNDPRVGDQWQYENTRDADIDAFAAWQVTSGSASVAIAILDTGIDLSHEDLTAKVTRSRNFTNSRTLDDRYGHGTHVAGSAAAVTNNGIGVAGTCPGCSLYNIKVLGDNGSGAWSGIANGIIWAADNGAKVVNLSLGSYSPSQTVGRAVDYAVGKGVVVIAAAGNDGQNWGFYPAAYPSVISVAATDRNDERASFSNYGSNWVRLAAPGAEILSTATDHNSRLFPTGPKYGVLSGTSMASPHVAGAAGLVWASGLCNTGGGACVRDRLLASADKIPGTGTLWIDGRLNACRAVSPNFTCSEP